MSYEYKESSIPTEQSSLAGEVINKEEKLRQAKNAEMQKKYRIISFALVGVIIASVLIYLFTAQRCLVLGHKWQPATCTTAQICTVCQATVGSPLGHSWQSATCDSPKICLLCGSTEGSAIGHQWNEATCTTPKTCKRCGTTDGKALGHKWLSATYDYPETCESCGQTRGTVKREPWENNILRDYNKFYEKQDGYWDGSEMPAFGSDIPRNKIISITFMDKLSSAPDDCWDVSEAGDGRVLAWAEKTGDNYNLFIAADEYINGSQACRMLFAGFTNLKEINNIEVLRTDHATSMYRMFDGGYNLGALDVSGFDTSKVTDMSHMFGACEALTSLDVSGFDTSNVTDMSYMFDNCWRVASLDVSGFDTSNVTDMCCMFIACQEITTLNLSGFDTSKVKNMEAMFNFCRNMNALDISSFDTSRVTNMSFMFEYTPNLKNLVAGNMEVSSVKDHRNFMDEGDTINGRPWEELFE